MTPAWPRFTYPQRLGGPRVCANPGTWEVLWSQDGGWSSQLVCRWSLLPFRFSAQRTRWSCILLFGMGPFSGEHAARFWTLLTSTALKDISWDPSSRFGKVCWASRDELFDAFCLNVLISWCRNVQVLLHQWIFHDHLKSFALLSPMKNECERYFEILYFKYDMRTLAFTHERIYWFRWLYVTVNLGFRFGKKKHSSLTVDVNIAIPCPSNHARSSHSAASFLGGKSSSVAMHSPRTAHLGGDADHLCKDQCLGHAGHARL